MNTLLARLAGPLQAWGAEPKLRVAGTHPTPTWSGLLGLARAALGHGRGDAAADIAWLRSLDMAVRVDQPGTVHVDFHTINPLPDAYESFEFFDPSDRGLVPLGTELQASGQAPRWLKGAAPMVTRRHLLHDAAFIWLVHGPDRDVERLAGALASPRWTLALGRKGCTPASPLLLGIHPGTILEAAQSVPLTGSRSSAMGGDGASDDAQIELVWIHGTPDPDLTIERTRVVLDNPLGSHPQHGYAAGQHSVGRVSAPTAGDLLTWSTENLTHPAWTPSYLETTA